MPTPARTSLEGIVRAGRDILETEGIDGVTMQRVASAVGVRAPSLYKRVRNRNDLLRLIGNDASRELTDRLDAAASSGDARTDFRAIAAAFRGVRSRVPAARTACSSLPSPTTPAPTPNGVPEAAKRCCGRRERSQATTMPWRRRGPWPPGRTASSGWSWRAPSGSAATSMPRSTTASTG